MIFRSAFWNNQQSQEAKILLANTMSQQVCLTRHSTSVSRATHEFHSERKLKKITLISWPSSGHCSQSCVTTKMAAVIDFWAWKPHWELLIGWGNLRQLHGCGILIACMHSIGSRGYWSVIWGTLVVLSLRNGDHIWDLPVKGEAASLNRS